MTVRSVTASEVVGRKAILKTLPGDSELGEETVMGTFVQLAESKLPGGTAYVLRTEDDSREKLRVHTADPRTILLDLEDLPVARLPGMPNYIGGAFVRIYGSVESHTSRDSRAYERYLGIGELVPREDQGVLTVPVQAYADGADEVVRLAARDFGVNLDFSPNSIIEAARTMADVGLSGVPSPDDVGRLKFLWGAYFGECLVRHYGGRWFGDPRLGMVVLLPRSRFPPAKVKPFRVAERIMVRKDAGLASLWLKQVEDAISSQEFLPPVVE